MQVRVLYFGVLRELRTSSGESVLLPDGATVAQLLADLQGESAHPVWSALAVAVNREYSRAPVVLRDGDEVALLPPVSGGADVAVSPPVAIIALTREPLDREALVTALRQPADGAVVVFDGVVRDNTHGRRTLYLDYEAYDDMARMQMERLAAQAKEKFAIDGVGIVHRLGRLTIGESSIVIVVTAAHRAAAFDACRWLIDIVKRTVPIWKKEHFADGAIWVDGEPFPAALTPGRGEQ